LCRFTFRQSRQKHFFLLFEWSAFFSISPAPFPRRRVLYGFSFNLRMSFSALSFEEPRVLNGCSPPSPDLAELSVLAYSCFLFFHQSIYRGRVHFSARLVYLEPGAHRAPYFLPPLSLNGRRFSRWRCLRRLTSKWCPCHRSVLCLQRREKSHTLSLYADVVNGSPSTRRRKPCSPPPVPPLFHLSSLSTRRVTPTPLVGPNV